MLVTREIGLCVGYGLWALKVSSEHLVNGCFVLMNAGLTH